MGHASGKGRRSTPLVEFEYRQRRISAVRNNNAKGLITNSIDKDDGGILASCG
jgi:phosphoribosylformylglycinamidine (FGAM) synthase-like enzyme